MKDESVKKRDKRATILDFDKVLGLGFYDSSKKLVENLSGVKKVPVNKTPDDVKGLLDEREIARIEKNWELADKLRGEIESKGYKIIDTDEGSGVVKST
jgi:cysteinyl-tRNA synthetase